MKKVSFWGGFHKSESINIRVNDAQAKEIEEGYYPLDEILSNYQLRRLDRHFCGVAGCTCGGVRRADFEII